MSMPEAVIRMPDAIPDSEELELIATRGYELLHRYRRDLQDTHPDQFIMINLESGDYVLAETLGAAIQKAKENYPGKPIYGGQIAYRRHFSHKGRAPYVPLGMAPLSR